MEFTFRMLKQLAEKILEPLAVFTTVVYRYDRLSLKELEESMIVPFFKQGEVGLGDYRLVSLTSAPGKL